MAAADLIDGTFDRSSEGHLAISLAGRTAMGDSVAVSQLEDSQVIPPMGYMGGSRMTTSPTTASIRANGVAVSRWRSNTTSLDVPTRPQRPTGPARTPSSTYAPQRRPSQYVAVKSSLNQRRSASANRQRRDPNIQYRAQEKAYVQRLRQAGGHTETRSGSTTPSLAGNSDGSATEDESPALEGRPDGDLFDQEILYFNQDMQPTDEEFSTTDGKERLEWHSMLAAVLTGDVVRQEKKRMIGSSSNRKANAPNPDMWVEIRAKLCGRPLLIQRKLLEDSRALLDSAINEVIDFQIKGVNEVGKLPFEQITGIIDTVQRIESLYPSSGELNQAKPKTKTLAYNTTVTAVYSWINIMETISTQLRILRKWVGNDELIFNPEASLPHLGAIHVTNSLIDRLLKEDGLKSLTGKRSILQGMRTVILKTKKALIQNADASRERHLPPYIEELLTLINFPTRLIQEIISVRMDLANQIKDPIAQGAMILDQTISQFQILLQLAIDIKQDYEEIAEPEPGWDLPPCMDENFEKVVLEALRFYFQMLNWRLQYNRNTFKEAEILEQEWGFCNSIGRHLLAGDVEVAEQFSSLTSKSLARLAAHLDRDLQKRRTESGDEFDKRLKHLLDSVRIRQRKLFRFFRFLAQRFENACEFSVEPIMGHLEDLMIPLVESGHFLVSTNALSSNDLWIIASPSLWDSQISIPSMLGTCYTNEEELRINSEDPAEDTSVLEAPATHYLLILVPEPPFEWQGKRLHVDTHHHELDLKPHRLRVIAMGSDLKLAAARAAYESVVGLDLPVVHDQRANLARVNTELTRIKKIAYKLANTILRSVMTIRRQTEGLNCQDLVQTCFAFAAEFGQRSLNFMGHSRRASITLKLKQLAIDWVSFICDDCDLASKISFRWAVSALEFAMAMTRGYNILTIDEASYERLRIKVGGCMTLLISHFDVMGARGHAAAMAERKRIDGVLGGLRKYDPSLDLDDETASRLVSDDSIRKLDELDAERTRKEAGNQALGRVLEEISDADRCMSELAASVTHVSIRWQQGQYIGGGSFGAVYAAVNLGTGYLMAVKEIRMQDQQLIPSMAKQIKAETTIMESLDHPNVVSYFGAEVHRDKVCIFMEYCSGGSLASLIEHGRIEQEEIVALYALQMCEGLAYLHNANVIHRDVKPENILFDHQGILKFVDFGAAKVIQQDSKTIDAEPVTSPSVLESFKEQSDRDRGQQKAIKPGLNKHHQHNAHHQNKSMTGTPMYMSPETIHGETPPAGRAGVVDVWSLACVILEMATGKRPWSTLDNEFAIMYNIAQRNVPQMPGPDQLSDLGRAFLARCFDKDPRKRATAAELLQDPWLQAAQSSLRIDSGGRSSSADEWGVTTPSSDGGFSAPFGGA